jgi:amidophosphoribosyltransferase
MARAARRLYGRIPRGNKRHSRRDSRVGEAPGKRYERAVANGDRHSSDVTDDHFHDECGVFGIWGAEEAANLAYLGLHALQHRGQESAGIVTTDGQSLFAHRALGLVHDVFAESTLSRLHGSAAIGHVRYSTTGESHLKNAQPIAIDYAHGSIAVGHNGNLTNAEELRRKLEEQGSIFATTTDTEVLVHLIARSKATTTVERVIEALKQVEGAYSMVFITPEELIAVRDPHGFRPLCLGQLKDATLIASEPPSFELLGGEFVRDIDPGELLVVSEFGVKSLKPFAAAEQRMCIFEYVYFARPDAHFGGVGVYEARKRLGARLAIEQPADVDIVIPVPDSGVPSALGFAEEIGRPFELGLIRSHYVGRTFIEPQQSIRHFGVRLKLHPLRRVLEGKRVAVIDDSIVRGTTSRKIVRMIRDAGAAEVHMRVSSPPTNWPCFYGIDTPSRRELIASSHTTDEIRRYIGADSLGYLSIEGLHTAVGGASTGAGFCDACFSGNYPVRTEPSANKGRKHLSLVDN